MTLVFPPGMAQLLVLLAPTGAGKRSIVELPSLRSRPRQMPDRRCSIKPLFDQNL
jgi:ribose 1,5-bisphosphokinase PhnN